MQCHRLTLVSFSPTSTTHQVLTHIAQGMEPEIVQHIDLTLPGSDSEAYPPVQGDVALLGMPVYAGRVPWLAAQRLCKVVGQGVPAVVIVVYGNRAYEDALLELKDKAVELGFFPVAGGAFIGEHSFATETTPIANGRPDENDCAEARAFGMKVKDLLASIASTDELHPLLVPGNTPYRERPEKKQAAPVADPEVCILCGTCAENCPSGAITIQDAVQADPASCILCHACVKNCPTEAIAFHVPALQELAATLHQNCQQRKEPELFLSTSG